MKLASLLICLAAVTQPLRIEQGATWSKAFDSDLDLTGCTLGMEIRTAPGGTLLAAPTLTETSLAAGTFTASLTANQTGQLTFRSGVYDVEATCGAAVHRLFQGSVTLSLGVTTDEVAPGEFPAPGTPPGEVYVRVSDLAINVKTYGATGDGTTDDSAAVQAAIDAAMGAAGDGPGGTIFFPAGTYLINSQITFPNTGAGLPGFAPKQPNLRLMGEAAEFSGQNRVPVGGTILDLRYDGTPAKIDTRGTGTLEITGLTVGCLGGTDDTPFIQSTNTTLLIHDAAFYGCTASPFTTNDAIILGGTTEGSDETANSGFQGYGTVISETYFQNVRRALYCRTWCNGIVFRHNEIWQGSGFPTGPAVDIDALSATGQGIGNLIEGNLFELQGYKYGIRVGYGQGNTLAFNNFYDPTATTTAFYRMEDGAIGNSIIDGYHITSTPLLSEATAGGTQTTVLTWHVGEDISFGNNAGSITLSTLDERIVTNGAKVGHFIHSNGSEFYSQMGGTAAAPEHILYLQPDGGTADAFVRLHYYGTAAAGISAQYVENRDGDLRLRAKGGNTLWIGDINGQSAYWQQSTRNLVINHASGRVSFGGVASTNVMLTPSGTTLRVRLGDDSGDANLTAATVTTTGPIQTQAVISATPSIGTACAAGTAGAMAYVDDTDDGAVSHLCFCGTDAANAYGWRRADAPGTACP